MANKGQGLTAGAAVVALGLLLRPLGSPDLAQNGTPGGSQTSDTKLKAAAPSEGPWIASCKYWAAARQTDEHDPPKPAAGWGTLHSQGRGSDITTTWETWDEDDKELKSGCSLDPLRRWGFPDNGIPINATSIIATVPDPVHTHLALTFDRTIDSLLQAASENHYVGSYYWLPWKNQVGILKAAEGLGDVEPGHNPERERQPGLIVLKHVPDPVDAGPATSYYDVIYLFLVAETPTEGVEGFQLQAAFSYQRELETQSGRKEIPDQFSRGRHHGRAAIIGPNYSGSAASLRAGIETAFTKEPTLSGFEVVGATITELSLSQLNSTDPSRPISYLSFADDRNFATQTFLNRICAAGYDLRRVARLVEEETVLGSASAAKEKGCAAGAQIIRFPREISLLRNAHIADDRSVNDAAPSPSPYLRFSLKDSSAQDSIPNFSPENMPLSQEAQLMAIARHLRRYRFQFIVLSASNPLDLVFLAQFLHRACPDARLVFLGSDLLLAREIDNVPFIGSITVSPYTLLSLGQANNIPFRAYSDYMSVSHYNAASYTFWDTRDKRLTSVEPKSPAEKAGLRTGDIITKLGPESDGHVEIHYFQDGKPRQASAPAGRLGIDYGHLTAYRNPLAPTDVHSPPLWATVIGRDGYYPLAILSPCASEHPEILPAISSDVEMQKCAPENAKQQNLSPSIIYPSLLWFALCIAACGVCLVHAAVLLTANYWSPFTRDLAIQANDQPYRRSTYILIASAILVSTILVISLPVATLAIAVSITPNAEILAFASLAVAIATMAAAIWKTRGYRGWMGRDSAVTDEASFFLNVLALLTPVGVGVLWSILCWPSSHMSGGGPYFAGLSFSYRCINPGSGVSPVVPVLLLLGGWYLWAFAQTRRLRFSDSGRPWLPSGSPNDGLDRLLFVSDDDLNRCETSRDCGLYSTITSLLITRVLLGRFTRGLAKRPWPLAGSVTVDTVLAALYFILFVGTCFLKPIQSLDRLFWSERSSLPGLFDFLVCLLCLPLIVVSITGWLRMYLIWRALRKGLLGRLENQPIRFAFGRLKAVSWITMLRQCGMEEQWRDMARSVESMRQILHQPDFLTTVSASDLHKLQEENAGLLSEIRQLLGIVERSDPLRPDYEVMRGIELRFAGFSRQILLALLIPYWKNQRAGLVEGKDAEDLGHPASAAERRNPGGSPAELSSVPPPEILVAEEFLALRYIALVQAVLANMRRLLTFVCASFVLAMVALHSYPFQPRQPIDWVFTGLLAVLGSGVVVVFAQMYRDPILSRVTATKENELGWEFYVRVVSFGVVPFVTWLAYQFPDIGSVIYQFIQPAVPVLK